VGDRGNSQIDQYDVTGAATFVRSWGSAGNGPGQFNRLLELAVDAAGNVYAVDRDNGRIQEFTPDGIYIRSFGSLGTGAGKLSQPVDVAVDGQGNVWVADVSNYKLVKYAPSGTLVADYGRVGLQGVRPSAVAVAPNGDIYAVDVGVPGPRVLRLRETPQIGKSVTVEVVSGTVLVKPPGSTVFTPVTAATNVAVGSTLDTTAGTVKLTAARNATGATQSGQFYSGVFQVKQKLARKPTTDLVLAGGSFAGCPKGRGASAAGTGAIRQLWGNATGKFRSVGRYSSASVRGTTWLTVDRCDGTLTKVKSGSVSVLDLVRHRTVIVKAPKSYLAKAR
jgi:hypothetical protein